MSTTCNNQWLNVLAIYSAYEIRWFYFALCMSMIMFSAQTLTLCLSRSVTPSIISHHEISSLSLSVYLTLSLSLSVLLSLSDTSSGCYLSLIRSVVIISDTFSGYLSLIYVQWLLYISDTFSGRYLFLIYTWSLYLCTCNQVLWFYSHLVRYVCSTCLFGCYLSTRCHLPYSVTLI